MATESSSFPMVPKGKSPCKSVVRSFKLNQQLWPGDTGSHFNAREQLKSVERTILLLISNMYHRAEGSSNSNIKGSAHDSEYPEGEPEQGWIHDQDQCSKILECARQALDSFIGNLGQIKHTPLKLALYQADFELAMLEQTVSLEDLFGLVESSIRKMKSNKKIKCNWSREDLLILLWIMEKYSAFHSRPCREFDQGDWNAVGAMIPGKNGRQAMFKWLGLKSNKCVQKRAWQEWEDTFLRQSVIDNDQHQWLKISQSLYLQPENTAKVYRTAKQCRERWACFVNPFVKKGNWTKAQDAILISKYLEIGKRWSIITKLLEGRTENAVKNRWKLIASRRKLLCKRSETTVQQFLSSYLVNLKVSELSTTEMTGYPSRSDLPQFESQDKLEHFLDRKPIQLQAYEHFMSLEDDLLFPSKETSQRPQPEIGTFDEIFEQYIGKGDSFKKSLESIFL